MIQAILSYEYDLNLDQHGNVNPEFKPIQLVFAGGDNTSENYKALIIREDLFGVFYQHTSGYREVSGRCSNFYTGRLKNTPYQVISYFKQEEDGTQFVAISIFELDDELDLFSDIIKEMGNKLESMFSELLRAKNSRKLNLIEKSNQQILDTIKFSIFQVDRLSNLSKLQKIALIYRSKERREILKLLREKPYSRIELKKMIDKINPNANYDILMLPFLQLNLVRRDWIIGELRKFKVKKKAPKKTGNPEIDGRKKETEEKAEEEQEEREAQELKKVLREQGEFLFLIKDIVISRTVNENILSLLKEKEEMMYEQYRNKLDTFFSTYDPLVESEENTIKLASALLKPDLYDFLILMRNNYYPLDKVPKILSEWADFNAILKEWTELSVLNTLTVEDPKKKREWLVLLADPKPLIFFPEYILPNIRKAYREKIITYEVAKKAYDLLEVTFPDKIET